MSRARDLSNYSSLATLTGTQTLTNKTIAGSVDVTANMNVTGRADFQEIREQVVLSTISASVVTANFNDGSIFYISASPTSNFTINVTNVPTDNNEAITITAIVNQGATGRIPNALQIDGSTQTIKWLGGSTPTPTSSAGKLDLFNFTLIRVSSSWIVLGSSSLNF